MSPFAWQALAFGSVAMSSLAGMMALFRMRQLKAMARISPELAEYYAPMLDGPVFKLNVGGGFNLRKSQRSRMAQGRAFKLAFSGHHRDIGDAWLSTWVRLQRLGLVAFIGAFLAMMVAGSSIPTLG